MNETSRTGTRLLRLAEVLARIPLKKASLYRAIRAGKFPPPCKLLGGRASAWSETEIFDYVEARLAERGEVRR